MQEDRLAEAISKAQQASELLNSEAFKQKVEKIKTEMIDLAFATNDVAERQRCVDLFRAIDRIEEELKADLRNGNQARRDLEDITSGRKRQQFGIV